MKCAEVILPLAVANTYTYRIPDAMIGHVSPLFRVVVPFGKRRRYTAIVRSIRDCTPDEAAHLKSIITVPDATPILLPRQMDFWEWIASYYLCKLGDVYRAAIPAGLQPDSETVVTLVPEFEASSPLRPSEQAVLDVLAAYGHCTVAELEKATGLRRLITLLDTLASQGAVTIGETLKRGFTPRTETRVRLAEAYRSEAALATLLDQLKRAPGQERMLLHFVDATRPFDLPTTTNEGIARKQLLADSGLSAAVFDGLIRRGVFETFQHEISTIDRPKIAAELRPLTDSQQKAYTAVKSAFRSRSVCLLHGVPSSGKTEIYLRLILDALQQGEQALYLLPDIAVASRIVDRLGAIPADRLLVCHSGLSDRRRIEVWNRLLHSSEPVVVVGARSSIFLPFSKLGLIVVDGEHDPAYRQHDPAPRYQARNAAVMLAAMHGAKTLLGSAAPSVESFFNAKTGKYGLVALPVRYGDAPLPHVKLIDTRDLKRRKIMKHDLFSPELQTAITTTIEAGGRVMLFQNRRGFAPLMECRSCAYIPRCIQCDVSLTYHKSNHRLVCHYCGYSTPLPTRCPACESEQIRLSGFGTERIEEAVNELFPGIRTARLDFDTARTRPAVERILTEFDTGRTPLLIGTQMLVKSIDLTKVDVAGIINADAMMAFPDFRAHERAFQLMTQLCGRTGHSDRPGQVLIQTAHPDDSLLQFVGQADYDSMARVQLAERSLLGYPPYIRLITIVLRSADEPLLDRQATAFAAHLLRIASQAVVLGPVKPPVGRIQALYIRRIIFKTPLTTAVSAVRSMLTDAEQALRTDPDFARIRLHYEVDN